jgi:hypothetical protein
MFWWLNFNPQINGWDVHWPWSGAVTQDITSTLWSRARNSRAERRVLSEVASYGRQIGTLNDLLYDMARKLGDEELTSRGLHAREQLKNYIEQVEQIKAEERQALIPDEPEEARRMLEALLARHPQLSDAGLRR